MPSVFVLAAGLGTRLRPLSDHVPKPLVPIGDRPAIAHVLERVKPIGRVVVNAFHKTEAMVAYGASAGVDVVCEASLLGTAGGLHHARARLDVGPVLVWNADIVATVDGEELMTVHAVHAAHASDGDCATLAVAPRAAGQGTVGLDADGRVVRLRGERFGDEVRGGEFLGIHVVGPALRDALPSVGCLVGDVYLPALRGGAKIGSYAHDGPFFDVGTLASYLDANLAWLAARCARSWSGKGAVVSSRVSVTRSVIGEGARVEADLDQCVVWPYAVATAPEVRAVVTPFGTFAVDPSPQPPAH